MIKLHYAGYQPDVSGFGWATCNHALVRELGKLCTVEAAVSAATDVVFQPLVNHDFDPASPERGRVNLAYTFFEFELGPNAAANAKKYDVVFAGSTWCLERMRERGIINGELLIQGVDNKIFKPFPVAAGVSPAQPARLPLQKKQFRIFSGGKFEFRKGQDLVIAAFREFSKTHAEAHLVCSWFNPWPELVEQELKRLDPARRYFGEQTAKFELLLLKYLQEDQFTVLPQLTQRALAREMRNTDLGLFPNRCEGGTNLVLMEYTACGKPVVANVLTGHADISNAIQYVIPAREDRQSHWAEQSVGDVVRMLEYAYKKRDSLPALMGPRPQNWTWSRAAETIVSAASRFLDSPARA